MNTTGLESNANADLLQVMTDSNIDFVSNN